MSNDLEWRCSDCKTLWVADFSQVVCRCSCERVKPNEHELKRPTRAEFICMGELMLSGMQRVAVTKGL